MTQLEVVFGSLRILCDFHTNAMDDVFLFVASQLCHSRS